MQKVDDDWLTERGALHDAKVLNARPIGRTVEISIGDEWAALRGFPMADGEVTMPKDERAPGTLVFDDVCIIQGALDDANGSWISEVKVQASVFQFVFCDCLPLALKASAVHWRKSKELSQDS